MKTSFTFLFLSMVLLFTTCKKDDEQTKTDLLCSKSWKLTECKVDPGIAMEDAYGNPITVFDLYAQWAPCEKDDVWKYNSDKSYTWDLISKCDGDGAQSGTGTWMFDTNETVITMDDAEDYKIIELTASKLKTTYHYLNYTYTLTYVH